MLKIVRIALNAVDGCKICGVSTECGENKNFNTKNSKSCSDPKYMVWEKGESNDGLDNGRITV